MSATDGKPTPRPDRARANWLLHPCSSAGRLTISSDQYEELRAECLALREELRVAKGEPDPAPPPCTCSPVLPNGGWDFCPRHG